MFKKLLSHPLTKLGIGTALVFQIVFFTVWLTAYDGVEERTDAFTVAVIAEEPTIAETLEKQLETKAPFTFVFDQPLVEAREKLDKREISMVMHIPASFLDDVQAGKKGQIDFYTNQSTPSVEKQMMETAATMITKELNTEVYNIASAQMNEILPEMVADETGGDEDAMMLAGLIAERIQQVLDVEMVEEKIYKEHDVDGFSATMIPLMVVLASYIGAMIMSQQMQVATKETLAGGHRLLVFLYRQIINLVVSFVLSMVTLGIMLLLGVELTASIMEVWIFQSVLFLSFLAISQLFVVAFGSPGMIFNVILTATQLVSSGAIVPRELLSTFYEKLGAILPATYGVNGYFSIIYGGGDLASEVGTLLWMIGLLWLMTCLIVWIFHIIDQRKKAANV